ncbi:hypothetical protein ACXJY6_06390 [Vibrio sp. RC27]
MSTKLTQLVWNYKTHKAEDKLLFLALAEIADNKGNFCTSMTELVAMTGMPDGVVRTLLQHFTTPATPLISLDRSNKQDLTGQFSGCLQIEKNPIQSKTSTGQVDLMKLAREQNERLNQNKTTSRAKLNRNQRSQIAPLDRNANEKQYSVLQIHMEEIPDWAEGIMYKQGVHNRKEIWDAFVVDVHATGEKLFSLSQLTNRLYQKIQHVKDLSFSRVNAKAANRPVKQSALSEFEEKVMNYLSEDDD